MGGLRATSQGGARQVLVELAAPRGFGAAYRRTAQEPASAEALQSLLGLVGYEASVEAIASWKLLRRVQAEVHATYEHLRASDNSVPRHPRPDWMPELWKGPREQDPLLGGDGPGGTPL